MSSRRPTSSRLLWEPLWSCFSCRLAPDGPCTSTNHHACSLTYHQFSTPCHPQQQQQASKTNNTCQNQQCHQQSGSLLGSSLSVTVTRLQRASGCIYGTPPFHKAHLQPLSIHHCILSQHRRMAWAAVCSWCEQSVEARGKGSKAVPGVQQGLAGALWGQHGRRQSV